MINLAKVKGTKVTNLRKVAGEITSSGGISRGRAFVASGGVGRSYNRLASPNEFGAWYIKRVETRYLVRCDNLFQRIYRACP